MKGSSSWQFKPYIRFTERRDVPYVTRLLPARNGFEIFYMDASNETIGNKLYVREKGTQQEYMVRDIGFEHCSIDGLEEGCEYEFFIQNAKGTAGGVRFVRTGAPIPDAVVVDYLHPEDRTFEFSGRTPAAPALVQLPSGDLLAADGIFVDRNPWPALPCISRLFKSKDGGKNWEYVSDLLPTFNGSLFIHKETLYFLALSGDYSDVVIAKSEDEGETWSTPVTLFRGENPARWGWHSSSVRPVEIGNRLYKAIEYGHVAIEKTENSILLGDKYYNLAHYVGVMSIDKDADLLVPENWTVSELYYPKDVDPYQCIEGNIIDGPNGVVNMLRTMYSGVSLMMNVDTSNPENSMYAPKKVTNFPLSAVSKFEVMQDPVTKQYIAVGNDYRYGRKLLVMAYSNDLNDWKIAVEIAGSKETESRSIFSYPSFIFDGEDLLVLSRTGYNGHINSHDTNMITFHRVVNFRLYLT